MSEETGQDKSFDATPEKKKKARKKGNIPISTDVAVFASYAGALVGLAMIGGAAVRFSEGLVGFFWHPVAVTDQLFSGAGGAHALLQGPLLLVGAVVLPAAVFVVVGLIAQQGIAFAPTKLKPDLKRIHPWEGMKRKYGATGMTEFLKSAAKITLVAAVGGGYLWSQRDSFLSAMMRQHNEVPSLLLGQVMSVLGIACGIAFLISLVDLPLQQSTHAKRLRMTRQEVGDENKEMEGDPTQRQARKRRAQELAQNQMLRDTASADVIIVNPTHYAVALKWDRSADSVPVCVAKGVDHFALSLIDRARLSGVPVREDPPCARALHATVDVGAPIRPEHFAAVAAAIRFAETVRPKR
ncbi:MAG: flagellar type III secretion system protein FlhB [Pseudomonadota bacterium]